MMACYLTHLIALFKSWIGILAVAAVFTSGRSHHYPSQTRVVFVCTMESEVLFVVEHIVKNQNNISRATFLLQATVAPSLTDIPLTAAPQPPQPPPPVPPSSADANDVPSFQRNSTTPSLQSLKLSLAALIDAKKKVDTVSTAVQAYPLYSAHEANTNTVSVTHTGMCHTEGGWPAEVDPTDGEQVAMFRKKVERNEDYIRSVLRLGTVVEGLVKQNNALDIYADYFSTPNVCQQSATTAGAGGCSLATVAVLRLSLTPKSSHTVKTITWRSGHDTIDTMITASLTPTSGAGGSHPTIAIFDVNGSMFPVSTFSTPHAAQCVQYHPKNSPFTFGSGLSNGHFALFDTRAGPSTVSTTPLHSDSVTAFSWIKSKTCAEFMSVGLDGKAMWWDERNLTAPLASTHIAVPACSSTTTTTTRILGLPATSLEYQVYNDKNETFMVGTLTGDVVTGTRTSMSSSMPIVFKATHASHAGPVTSLVRHPMFNEHVLSVGDWTCRVWRQAAGLEEAATTPLIATPCQPHTLSGGGMWSLCRPSAFYCGDEGGYLHAWDLLKSHASPVWSASLADCALTSMVSSSHTSAVPSHRELLGIGCRDGNILVVDPAGGAAESHNVSDVTPRKVAFEEMLEREYNREKSLSVSRGAGKAVGWKLDVDICQLTKEEGSNKSAGAGGGGEARL